ncbi:MAG: hypothetical protein ACOC44_18800 [Promethearchaeia archaeon]
MGKFSDIIKKVSDIFTGPSSELEEIIEKYREYIEIEDRTVGKAKNGFKRINSYIVKNIEASMDQHSALGQIYDTIDKYKQTKISKYKSELIKPLEELVLGYEKRQEEFEEAKKAEEKYNDLKNDYEKLKSKPPEKVDEEKLQKAKQKFQSAKQTFEKEESEARMANRNFEKEKENTMQKIIHNIISIEIEYFAEIMDNIKQFKKEPSPKKSQPKEE